MAALGSSRLHERDANTPRRAEEVRIHAFVIATILRYGLPLVALMIFGGELGLPTIVPMEVALLLVGAYTVSSLPILVGGFLLVTVADVAGTTLLYLALRTSGRRLVARIVHWHGARGAGSAERWSQHGSRHEVAAVFVGRVVPLVRMYVPFGAAIRGLAPRPYLLGAVPGGAIWAGTPLVAGYLFSGDVQRIAVGYTRFAHALLFVLPAAAALAVAVWWTRSAEGMHARRSRGRAVLGLAAVAATGIYAAALMAENEHALAAGGAALPLSLMVAWMAALAVLALALLAVAVADVRAAGRHLSHHLARPWEREWVVTVAWAGLLVVLALVMVGLELHYPHL